MSSLKTRRLSPVPPKSPPQGQYRPNGRLRTCTPSVHVCQGRLLDHFLDRVAMCCAAGAQSATSCAKVLGLVFQSAAMARVVECIRRVANSDCSVVVEGESGTGKELVARAIHNESERRTEPFIALNCAALPETTLESELFGYEPGAFTGATKSKPGMFELANAGTIFLDEIADMSIAMQAKVLRVLEDGTFRRLGGTRELKTFARVVCATNRNLKQACKRAEFRSDLFFRLTVVTINLPPLRDRAEDIPLLVTHFLELLVTPRVTRKSLSEDALEALCEYDWPGNVRELQNTIERAVVLADGPMLTIADFYESLRRTSAADDLAGVTTAPSKPHHRELKPKQRAMFLELAKQGKLDPVKTPEEVGISRASFYRWCVEFGIDLRGPAFA